MDASSLRGKACRSGHRPRYTVPHHRTVPHCGTSETKACGRVEPSARARRTDGGRKHGAEVLIEAGKHNDSDEVAASTEKILVLGCGALARELLDVMRRNRLDNVTVECLPAKYHNTPSLIPGAVAERLERGGFDRALIGYGDCGTGGALDAVLEKFGAERLPGAHCYEFFATGDVFAGIHDDDPRTFYLTDFLARNFDRLVWTGLGLDRHPELLDAYFGNYRRVVYLSQFDNKDTVAAAQRGAARLGLEFEHRRVGLGDLETEIVEFSQTRTARNEE